MAGSQRNVKHLFEFSVAVAVTSVADIHLKTATENCDL